MYLCIPNKTSKKEDKTQDGLVHDCIISSALEMEISKILYAQHIYIYIYINFRSKYTPLISYAFICKMLGTARHSVFLGIYGWVWTHDMIGITCASIIQRQYGSRYSCLKEYIHIVTSNSLPTLYILTFTSYIDIYCHLIILTTLIFTSRIAFQLVCVFCTSQNPYCVYLSDRFITNRCDDLIWND